MTVFLGSNGNPLWQIVCANAAADLLEIQLFINGAWLNCLSLNPVNGGVAIANNPGMPTQNGLSVGLGKRDGSDAIGGNNYIKMFSNDPLEQYFQINIGMHGDPVAANRYAFWECVDQGAGYPPYVIDKINMSSVGIGVLAPQAKLHVATVNDANCSTQSRNAIRIDGGSLANGWERVLDFVGNGGAVVVGAVSAFLSGAERRLRLWAGGRLVAELHEDGGMTIGNVPSKGPGTLNVSGALYVNGVLK